MNVLNAVVLMCVATIALSLAGCSKVSDTAAPPRGGSDVQTRQMAVNPTADRVLGVYYFGIWSDESDNLYGRDEVVYGRSDPWAGVRDFHGDPDHDPPIPINTQGWDEDFSHLKPAIGYYDQTDPETLERHIRQLKSHGLSFLNFYWYWDNVSNDEIHMTALHTYLEAENSKDIWFMLSITAHPWGTLPIPAEDAPMAVDKALDYLHQPHYLTTRDGRPIIHILDARGIKDGTASDAIDFVALIRARAAELGLVDPYVLITSEYEESRQVSNAQGYSCLNVAGLGINPGSPLIDFRQFADRMPGYWRAYNDKPYMPCTMSHFDEKPRTELMIQDRSEVRYATNWSMAEYERNLDDMEAFIAATHRGSPIDGYATIYAWNEWRESGFNIEPGVAQGDVMLAAISEAFSLPAYPESDGLCRIYGDCQQSYHDPVGTLDAADCDRLAGWSRDEDSTTPIEVHVYAGAPADAGGQLVHTSVADGLRADLPFADQDHGFSVPTPEALKTGQDEEVYVYGASTNGNGDGVGDLVLLALAPRTVRCGGEPDLDVGVTDTGGADVVETDTVEDTAAPDVVIIDDAGDDDTAQDVVEDPAQDVGEDVAQDVGEDDDTSGQDVDNPMDVENDDDAAVVANDDDVAVGDTQGNGAVEDTGSPNQEDPPVADPSPPGEEAFSCSSAPRTSPLSWWAVLFVAVGVIGVGRGRLRR